MSLRSVVKVEVKWPGSEKSNKCKKKRHRAEREDSSYERSRIRERGDAKESPEKMKRKHSEERSESEESDEICTGDSARKVQNPDRQASHESDERDSSDDRWNDVKKDREGEIRDQKKLRNDDDHEDSREKESDQREYDDRSRQRDEDRSHRDYDRSRQGNKRSHRDDDRSRQRDKRSHRDDDRASRRNDRSKRDDERSTREDDQPRQDNERSHKDDDRSRQDNERSRKDDDRSRRDDDRSHRNGDRSRQDNDRSNRDDDRSRRQDERSHRSNDRSRHDNTRSEQNDDRRKVESSRPKRRDEKSIDTSDSKDTNQGDDAENYLASKRAKPSADSELTTRTGGAYIPPARLRMMQAQITDKSSAQYQRIAWEALKKSINGLINKVNVSNIGMIVLELLQENIVRGRGLLARSIMQAQAASPTFTHVYAALVAIINTKFPNIGELIVKRLIVSFKKAFRRNEKATCLSSLRFIAHLFNQLVCHEVLALQVLMLLVSQPTDDSVEVAVGFLKECGKKLKELSPKSLNAVFESLRTVLHEATIDKRVQYMIEVMFAIRKDGFKDHPSVIEELDLVEEEDQYTHVLKLDDQELDPEDGLNVFKFDPQYLENEEKYKAIKREHLDEGDSDDEDAEDVESGEGDDEDEDDEDDEDGGDGEGKEKTVIIDSTETNLVAFRRTLYLTIQSSLDFEECAHKIRKMEIKPGQEDELCNMILDCCAQQRTYEKFFGLLAQRFCMMEKKFLEPFQKIFKEQYDTVHRLETNKLRNVAKFFSHLLHTDAIDWKVLECVRLNEDDTTSSGRIFIKILFQELSEFMGLSKLNDRLKDVTLQQYFEGLFPRDNPRNTRFAINFFTSIGLGGLTDELRDHLKSAPKQPNKSPTPVELSSSESESSSSEDDSDSSSSNDSSSSSSSSSDSEPSPAKKRRRVQPSETPEKSHKSGDRRKSKHSQQCEKSLTPAKSSHKSEGPTSMQLRLMKLASYGQLPEDKDSERDKAKVRGLDQKRDEDSRGRDRGRETHPRHNDDRQGHRRGQESDSESEREKEQRKRNRKPDEDRRRNYEDSEKGHKDKRKHEEDSESDRGRKHKRRSEDSASDKDRERKGRRSSDESSRGRERKRDKSGERRRRRSRS